MDDFEVCPPTPPGDVDWDCIEPVVPDSTIRVPWPIPIPARDDYIVGVGVSHMFYRVDARYGHLMSEYTTGLARCYVTGGPGGEADEFYVSAGGVDNDSSLLKLVGNEEAWRIQEVEGSNVGMVTVDAPLDGSDLGVNLDLSRIAQVSPTTGAIAALSPTPLVTGVVSRDALLTPEADGMVIATRTSPNTSIYRVAWDGTVVWSAFNTRFHGMDTLGLKHYNGHAYLRARFLPGFPASIIRYDIASGSIDGSWELEASVLEGEFAFGRGPSSGRMFVPDIESLLCYDVATRAEVWETPLYPRPGYVVAGPEGEVYVATNSRTESDTLSRVYRIEADGTIAWELVLPTGITLANDRGGIGLSYGHIPAFTPDQ